MIIFLGLVRPPAATFDLNDPSWEVASEIFALSMKKLGSMRLEISATLDYWKLAPNGAVVILHPYVSLGHKALIAFIRALGRVGVLDDFGADNSFLARFEIFRVIAPQTPARGIRDNASLPIADHPVQLVAGHEQNRHPISQNVEGVVSSHPTALKHRNRASGARPLHARYRPPARVTGMCTGLDRVADG